MCSLEILHHVIKKILKILKTLDTVKCFWLQPLIFEVTTESLEVGVAHFSNIISSSCTPRREETFSVRIMTSLSIDVNFLLVFTTKFSKTYRISARFYLISSVCVAKLTASSDTRTATKSSSIPIRSFRI